MTAPGPPTRPEVAQFLGALERVVDARVEAHLDELAQRIAAEIARLLAGNGGQRASATRDRADRAMFFTVPETAERLAVSRTTVYELIRRGELRTVKIGGARRIDMESFERIRARGTGAAARRGTPAGRAPAA